MAANHYGNNVSVMVPAALQDNYKKELAKWLPPEDAAKFNVTSQQKLVRNGADSMPSPDVMVVDEAHRAEGFPSYTEENITVPLARPQQDIYKTIMNQAPAWVRWKVRAGLPPNRQELQPLQAFLTGARQVSNSDWTSSRIRINSSLQRLKLQQIISEIRLNKIQGIKESFTRTTLEVACLHTSLT